VGWSLGNKRNNYTGKIKRAERGKLKLIAIHSEKEMQAESKAEISGKGQGKLWVLARGHNTHK
jgi:hypothetical protein